MLKRKKTPSSSKNGSDIYAVIADKYHLELNEVEWTLIRGCIEAKSLALLKHEQKLFARVGFDPSRYYQVNRAGRIFFIISSRVFYYIIEEVLVEACQKFSSAFGIYRTDTILQALYNIEPPVPFNDFADFLKNEQFAWIIELTNNTINPQILRVDLFRQINSNGSNKSDFTGGLFHAFKHFSYNGIPLSTHPEKNDLVHPKDIYNYLIDAFFFHPLVFIGGDKYTSAISYNEKYSLLFHFYLESITKTYFISSIRKEKRRRI